MGMLDVDLEEIKMKTENVQKFTSFVQNQVLFSGGFRLEIN